MLKRGRNGCATLLVRGACNLVTGVAELKARLGPVTANRVRENVLTGRAEIPRPVGKDWPGNCAWKQIGAVANVIGIDEHAPGGETGGSGTYRSGNLHENIAKIHQGD